MKSFVKDYKIKDNSKFLNRYAQVHVDSELIKASTHKAEFEKGYKEGKLNYTTASKYMNLVARGAGAYSEKRDDGLEVVWAREGDSIVRIDSDLSWVDELLSQIEEKK